MPRLNAEGTPKFLEEASYDAVFDLMVTQNKVGVFMPKRPAGISFTNVMAYLTDNNPDVFLFTHKSAIPVADSVRGYYEERGVPVPDLAVVNTKNKKGRMASYNRQGSYGVLWPRSLASSVIERESKALRPLVEGKKVAIIDQLILSGTTVKRAAELAELAGAAEVRRPSDSDWYYDAHPEDVDIANVTSRHAPQMKDIGHAAARFEVPVVLFDAYKQHQ